MTPNICETTPYDPRYDRGQSIEDAKARYVHLEDYTLADLECDLDRLIRGLSDD